MKAQEPDGAGLTLTEATTGLDALRFAHEAMATVFEVVCAHDDPRYARQAAGAAFELLDRLEQEQSRFIANSDISRINALEAGRSARVSPETMECLEIARRMHAVTRGAFDVSVGTGLDRLELAPDVFEVRVRQKGVRLDLGGIGKGYAIDRMAEVLDDWGIHHALLHGGFSSVLALDAPPGRDGWPLTLTAPGPDRTRIRLSARQMALSASGTQKGAHILDPRSGRAVGDRAAWAVLHGRTGAARSPAAVAEALSTAFMILPMEDIAELCREIPGLEAWVAREPRGGEIVHLGGPEAG